MNIPKRISFFWAGGAPFSWMRYMSLWSFRRLNPDWSIHLFLAPAHGSKRNWATGEPQDCDPPIQCRSYLSDVAALGIEIEQWHPPADYVAAGAGAPQLADLCRWGVLSKFGGWFADTDILFVDSMDAVERQYRRDAERPLKEGMVWREADVALPVCRDWLPTGLIGTVPGNRFSDDLYRLARQPLDFRQYQAAGRDLILRQCGIPPDFPTDKRAIAKGLAVGFPGTRFWLMHHLTCYRWEWYDANRIFDCDEEVFPDTVGIHWYAGSRVGQKFNRKYDASNFRQDTNTFTRYARDLLDSPLVPDTAAQGASK